MKSLTHCLSRIVYHLDLDDLPLDRDRAPRPRTYTTSGETNFAKVMKFTDIKPRLTHSNSTLSTLGELKKAKTFDSDSNCNPTLGVSGEDMGRRHSTPARPLENKPSSHLGIKKPLIKHEPVIEEETIETFEGDNKKLLLEDGNSVSLVISNEDVSSFREEDEVQPIDHAPSSVPVLRRSLSENTSLGNIIRNKEKKHSIRSLSPDLSQARSHSPLTQGPVFASFIPKTTLDNVTTPPLSDSPSSITSSGASTTHREVIVTLPEDEGIVACN